MFQLVLANHIFRSGQFLTNIEGLDIHFMHVRSKEPNAVPLILTHGWPSSFLEFRKMIGPLVDPVAHGGKAEDAFHVVCPSLPGFAFSGKATTLGWGVDRTAAAWSTLMARLGYDRYIAHGGDWGAGVTTAIAAEDPDHCAGIHITFAFNARLPVEGQPTPEEQRALDGIAQYDKFDSGHAVQQVQRPQTLSYALNDSPVGQAAWILEKFWAWADERLPPDQTFDRDELLDNVMLYWLCATAASSARMYWESYGPRRVIRSVDTPTGVAVFPREIMPAVRRWMEPTYRNIQHWTEMPSGGHFAAAERPELLLNDLRTFGRIVR